MKTVKTMACFMAMIMASSVDSAGQERGGKNPVRYFDAEPAEERCQPYAGYYRAKEWNGTIPRNDGYYPDSVC